MKTILSYTGVFLLGLVFGYFVNIFVTNRSYYDILSENRELKFQIENLKSSANEASFEPVPESSQEDSDSQNADTFEEIQEEYKAPETTKAAPESVRPGKR